jgi:hypothetical protein
VMVVCGRVKIMVVVCRRVKLNSTVELPTIRMQGLKLVGSMVVEWKVI